VESFLGRLISQELVKKYIDKYDDAYEEAKKRLERVSPKRREGAIAVRIWRLCVEINEQGRLDHEQRIFVVVQALEFCKSDGKEISQMELGFIRTLAEGLNIKKNEYNLIELFVLTPLVKIPDSPNLLLIDGKTTTDLKETRHLYKELLRGQIWILYVPSVNIYFLRYKGSGELSMSVQLLHEDKVYPFSEGSSIRCYKVKPIYYWDVTMQFLMEDFQSSRVVYEVRNLEYRFRSGEVGIHHMSFKTESGRMVGIMGASGAGNPHC
jgi:ABC-type multidrug transport system fused ATPase/permease subunit/ribosomal protein S17E